MLVVHEQFGLTTSGFEFRRIDQLARNTFLDEMVMDTRHCMVVELSDVSTPCDSPVDMSTNKLTSRYTTSV